MTARDDAEVVEAVAGHRLVGPTTDSTDPRWNCICGEEISRSGWTAEMNFAAHLAAALLPLIREREAAAWERALREAADVMEGVFRGGHTLGKPTDDWLRDRAAANPYAGSEGGDE